MVMRYMLDTNICIHLMQGQPAHVGEKFATLRQSDVVMSAITYAELRAGVERRASQREQLTKSLALLTESIPVLPFDQNAGVKYGELFAVSPERRKNSLDRLIASHALSRALVLVTNNESDFRHYPGLRLENWVANPH